VVEIHSAVYTKPVDFGALGDNPAIRLTDRFDGGRQTAQAVLPVLFPLRGQSKQFAPSLYPEYSVRQAGREARAPADGASYHWPGKDARESCGYSGR